MKLASRGSANAFAMSFSFYGLTDSTRERAGIAGIDVHDIARRLRGTLGGEECHGLRHVFGIYAALEQAALAIHRFQLVDALLVLRGALLRPFALPDARATKHGVRIHDVHADAERRAFESEAAGEVQFGGLGRAIRGGAG